MHRPNGGGTLVLGIGTASNHLNGQNALNKSTIAPNSHKENSSKIPIQHGQKPQIYQPPDRCSTREKSYARRRGEGPANGADEVVVAEQLERQSDDVDENGKRRQPIFTVNSLQQGPTTTGIGSFKFASNFGRNDDDDFWEEGLNQPTMHRRMSAMGIEFGANGGGNWVPQKKLEMANKEKGQNHWILLTKDILKRMREMASLTPSSPPEKVNRATSATSNWGSNGSSRSRIGISPKHKREGKNHNEPEEYGPWAKLVAEFTGAFCLVFIGSLSGLGSPPDVGRLHTGLATGFTIFVLVASVGQISGGHFNPAVSFAVALARKMSFLQMTLYWFAQIAGAIVGALFLRIVTQPHEYESIAGGATILRPNSMWYQAILAEALLTAFLVQTILNAAVEHPANPLAPLAIGSTVLVDIIGCGALSGASMNPARSFGPCLVATFLSTNLTEANIWSQHYVYWIGPFIGATFSALAYRVIFTRNSDFD